MKRSLGLIIALVAAMGAGTSQAGENVRQIAESSIAKWNAAFAKGKVEEILSLYADNAMLVQPNGAVSKSTGEIRAFWQMLIQKGVYAMDVVDARSEKDDTIVATTKLSDVKTLQGPLQVMKYRYDGVLYSVLKRQADGSWKAQVQQWSGNHKI
ncbi:YybH family protein [Methylocaldum sp.]|uniref:YybH family protein n=1 Tax=Methylocaldum sp. TaxID=1969727 RepID=UPI002D3AA8A0|nr:DUF4440 domain-containing protein [Methylocaldum sp.]HYE36382.1 DUF4440 domain-containing protein [Methylocaldum sp.]